ncbi:MAG: DUF479 domain-containing protein [Zoogloea sp.]|nr:DUF479 domain-containing protein [Zoogloea sp.]
MNYLAHAFLAGAHPADRVGGVAGDFVKGSLPGLLPPDLASGVRLHRLIDGWADSQPAFMRSRARVSAARRRVSGVMVDMFYDHFLARHWARYHHEPLADFAAVQYALLESRREELPAALLRILPYMQAGNWLLSYREVAAVAHALDRMAQRMRQPNMLAGAGEELIAAYPGFEADFHDFLPQALAFASQHRQLPAPAAV